MELCFIQFFNKFLKFEEMEYFIHHVKVEIRSALCKFFILFPAVDFKLGQNFSQFIYRVKIGSFETLLYFQIFSNSQRDLRSGYLKFPYFHILTDCEDYLSVRVYSHYVCKIKIKAATY